MSRKLIPLTNEVKIDCLNEKLDLMSLELKAARKLNEKLTRKNSEKIKKRNQTSNDESLNSDVLNKVRRCKTIEEQKKHALQRERKALEACRGQPEEKYEEVNFNDNIDNSSQKEEQDQVVSESRSRFNVVIPRTSSYKSDDYVSLEGSKLSLQDVQEQSEIEGNRIKVYKCGQKLYAKLNETDDDDCCDSINVKLQKNCNRRVNLSNPELKVFTPRRDKSPWMNLSLGKPYGIQLGSLNIASNCFPKEFHQKQALDVSLVAHGMTFIKQAVCWSQQDIDNILILGTELHKETKDVVTDKLSQLTKGFTFKKHAVQVTMSEPIVVGRLLSFNVHSVDLLLGLEKFFSQHRQGILQAPGLDLYISIKSQVFFVFDPRGRTMDCVRNTAGEAALMVFTSLHNVYHLIMNLSNVDVKFPFKICKIEVTQLMDSKNSPEKFFASSGNPSSKPRSDDFKLLNDHVAYLQGSVHFNSKVFGTCCNKQQLTSSIIAIVYAKIDPPNSWSITQLDRILHFGTQMYRDFLQGQPARNLTLLDIPSKFYVGNIYRVGINIAPFIKRVKLVQTRVFCDNPITKALRCIFEKSSFHCFLIQVGINTFALWQMISTEVFYFFDGQQKDVNANRYEGSSTLFMTTKFDKLCAIVVQHVMSQPLKSNEMLEIHGIKVVELSKLTEKEQKCKKGFKVKKLDYIKPMTPEIADKFEESPSTVDSIAAVLTTKEINMMNDNITGKPETMKFNPPSCCKNELKGDDEAPDDDENKFSLFTSNLVRTLYSEMIAKVTEEDEETINEEPKPCVDKKPCGASKKGCGKFVACAEKVWLKRDFHGLDKPQPTKVPNTSEATVITNTLDNTLDSSGSDEYLLAE